MLEYGIAFVYIIVGLIAISFFIQKLETVKLPNVVTNDNEIWDEYMYLGRKKLKFAQYNTTKKMFELYYTDGNNTELIGESIVDPSLFYYDVVNEKFMELSLLNINVDTVDNETTVTVGDGKRVIIRYDGMSYNPQKKKLEKNILCEQDKLYPVTTKLYKTLLNLPSSEIGDGVVLGGLFAKCDSIENKFTLGACGEGEDLIDGKCQKISTFAPFSSKIPSSLLPHTEKSFIRVNDNKVSIIHCKNGVNSTKTACNDVECVDKNGYNYTEASYQQSFHPSVRPVYRQALKCQDGRVVSNTYCGNVKYESTIVLRDERNEIISSLRLLHPKRIYNKKNNRCMLVNGNLLANRPLVEAGSYYKALDKSVFLSLTTDSKLVVKQRFHEIPNEIWVPSIHNPTHVTIKRKKNVRMTFANSLVVYKNSIYESKFTDLPQIDLPDPLPFFRIVKVDDTTRCTVLGNTIIDVMLPDPENSQSEDDLILELMKSPDDDLYHTPVIISYLKEKGYEHLANHGIKYHNTATIYNIDMPLLDLGMCRDVWRSLFGITEKVKSRQKRV